MNTFNKGFGLAFIIIVIAAFLAAGSSYWYVQNKYQPTIASPNIQTTTSSQQEHTPTPASSNSNLKTYTNSQYGFSMQYPSSFQRRTDFSDIGYPTMTPPLLYVDNPSDLSEKILAGASSDPADVSECISTTDANTIVTINGMTFHRYDGTDPAAGQEGLSHVYALVKNGTCYWIRTSFIGTEISHLNTQAEKNAELASEAKTFEKLDVAVTSFKFTNTSQTSVPGMSQYTDKDFGFSFWYPSGWTVSACRPNNLGNEVCENNVLYVGTRNGAHTLTISKETPSNKMLMENYSTDAFFFDSPSHVWMWTHNGQTSAADISNNTMGGLHMFNFTEELYGSVSGHDVAMPLSAENFAVVHTDNNCTKISCTEINANYLAKTVVATDPSVATPVSAAQQIKIIQAEKDAYAAQ